MTFHDPHLNSTTFQGLDNEIIKIHYFRVSLISHDLYEPFLFLFVCKCIVSSVGILSIVNIVGIVSIVRIVGALSVVIIVSSVNGV